MVSDGNMNHGDWCGPMMLHGHRPKVCLQEKHRLEPPHGTRTPLVVGMATHNRLILFTSKVPATFLSIKLKLIYFSFSLICLPHTCTL